MMRNALLIGMATGLISVLIGLIAGAPLQGLAIVIAVILAAFVFERAPYGVPKAKTPDSGWERTNELFFDPVTGRELAVWFNPRTGDRQYVESDAATGSGL